jgi:hypothetical protein
MCLLICQVCPSSQQIVVNVLLTGIGVVPIVLLTLLALVVPLVLGEV